MLYRFSENKNSMIIHICNLSKNRCIVCGWLPRTRKFLSLTYYWEKYHSCGYLSPRTLGQKDSKTGRADVGRFVSYHGNLNSSHKTVLTSRSTNPFCRSSERLISFSPKQAGQQ